MSRKTRPKTSTKATRKPMPRTMATTPAPANITLSDVPERKSDLVQGRYAISSAKPKQTVAVKIVDMLGEEVLATHEA